MSLKKTGKTCLSASALVVSLFILLLSLSCCSTSAVLASEGVKADANLLKKHVIKLAKQDPPRIASNPGALKQAADDLKAEFSSYGLESELQPYLANGHAYYNVIAKYGNPQLPVLVIGAHYDSCHIHAGVNPGADDNASAVAGLLECARLVATEQPSLDYRIEFVAFTLEEPPYFGTKQMGSYIHAQQLHAQKQPVAGMICLEMIGYFSDQPNSQEYPVPGLSMLYPTTGNFIALIGNRSAKNQTNTLTAAYNGTELPVESIRPLLPIKGMDFSDHRNYWHFDWPAVMITDTAFYRNPNYHRTTDTPETLDYKKMALVIEGLYTALLDFSF